MVAIGAGIAALACIGAGIGIGIATSKAAEAVARQPEAEGKITKTLLLGGALAEATAIYGFVIGILIILFMGGSTETNEQSDATQQQYVSEAEYTDEAQ